MKPLFVFLTIVLTFATVLANHLTKDEVVKKMREKSDKCLESHKITDEEHDNWNKGVCPSSDTGKCFLKCVYEETGMIADGKFSLTKSKDSIKEVFSENADKMKIAENILEKCNEEVGDASGCDAGLKTCQCLRKHMDEEKNLFDE